MSRKRKKYRIRRLRFNPAPVIAGVAIAALGVLAFSFSRGVAKTISSLVVRFDGIKKLSLRQITRLTFDLILEVTNPAPQQVTVDKVTGTINLGGRDGGDVFLNTPFTIPSGGRVKVSIPVSLNAVNLALALGKRLLGKGAPIQSVFNGFYTVGGNTINVKTPFAL